MDGANMHADIVHNFDLQSVVRTQTGTAPFDSDDEAGNDSSGDNSIVRSFDKVQYDMTYSGEISTDVQSVEMDGSCRLMYRKNMLSLTPSCYLRG